MGPDNLDYLDRSWIVLASEESDDFFRVCFGMLQFYFEMVHGLLSLPSSSFDFRPNRFNRVQARSGGSGHRLVTAFQVIEHRRVGAGGFAAPVEAGFEQAAATPAVDGADADAEGAGGLAGANPDRAGQGGCHRWVDLGVVGLFVSGTWDDDGSGLGAGQARRRWRQ